DVVPGLLKFVELGPEVVLQLHLLEHRAVDLRLRFLPLLTEGARRKERADSHVRLLARVTPDLCGNGTGRAVNASPKTDQRATEKRCAPCLPSAVRHRSRNIRSLPDERPWGLGLDLRREDTHPKERLQRFSPTYTPPTN